MEIAEQGETGQSVMCQLTDPEGNHLGPSMSLPQNASPKELQQIVNKLLNNVRFQIWSLYWSACLLFVLGLNKGQEKKKSLTLSQIDHIFWSFYMQSAHSIGLGYIFGVFV